MTRGGGGGGGGEYMHVNLMVVQQCTEAEFCSIIQKKKKKKLAEETGQYCLCKAFQIDMTWCELSCFGGIWFISTYTNIYIRLC